MKARHLIECTIDPSKPITEIIEVISAVLMAHPVEERVEIIRQLDEGIGEALAIMESEQTKSDSEDTEV